MAMVHSHHLFSHNIPTSFHTVHPKLTLPLPLTRSTARYSSSVVAPASCSSSSSSSGSFSWDDVFQVTQSKDVSSDLQGFFDKIKLCNRDSENSCGGHFGGQVTLHSTLKTPEQRTKAVGNVVKFLGEERIPGIRNELYPVTSSFGTASYFPLERAAASYFGIKAYEVHMNGYVERDGQKYLWIAKRSAVKSNYPGMLDHLVAGGLPRDISSQKDLVKECEEEAGIPIIVADYAIPIGAVSYIDIDGCNYRRDVIFCYDLKLPECFIPKNQGKPIRTPWKTPPSKQS